MDPMQVIILGASKYSFEDRETGRQIEGCKVHFLNLEEMDEENVTGFIPSSANMPYKYHEAVRSLELPHLAEAGVTVSFTGKKPTVKIASFDPIKPFPLFALNN